MEIAITYNSGNVIPVFFTDNLNSDWRHYTFVHNAELEMVKIYINGILS